MNQVKHPARYIGPNVLAVTWKQNGYEWTLFRSVPGTSRPRLSWVRAEGVVADTSVSEPERFGEYATDERQKERRVFGQWADAFIGGVCDCHATCALSQEV